MKNITCIAIDDEPMAYLLLNSFAIERAEWS